MIDPVAHFKKVSELLLNAGITDGKGSALRLADGASAAVDLLLEEGRKVMIIGNGGSAAIATHMHNDLCNSVGIPAMTFNESAQLTALANDHGYEQVFERPIDLWAKSGDLLVAISSSGKSENILKGVQAAKKKGCDVITLSGFRPDNPLRQLGQINFYVASQSYGEVEVSHMSLVHYLTDCCLKMKVKAGKS